MWTSLGPTEQHGLGCPGTSKSPDGLLVGRTLVDLSSESVPVQLLNLTNHPKRIKQGTPVAICNAVTSVLV